MLYLHVGNEDADHGVQGRARGVKGVGKCKLIKLERNLCVPNYVELFTIFLAAFCHILIVALTLLLFVNFPRVGQLRAADIVVLISFPLP